MNRTIKEATVKPYRHESHDQLRAHLGDFAERLLLCAPPRTLKGLTPYEFVCKGWTEQPGKFKFDPRHQMPGLNTSGAVTN